MSLKKYSVLSILMASIICGCKERNQHDKNLVKSPVSQTDGTNTILKGVSDDTLSLRYFNLLTYSTFNGTNDENIIKYINEDSIRLSTKALKKPQLMEIMAFGLSFHNFKVYMTPGDTVDFELKNGKWKFEGANSAHYNFFSQKSLMALKWPAYDNDMQKYKDGCAKVYQQKKELFEQYLVSNNSVSEGFISEVNAELKFEYLYNLVAPRDIKSEIEEVTFNNMNGVFSSINKEFNSQEKGLFDAKTYFDDIQIEDFKRPELINNDYFKRSLIDYIRHYLINQDYLSYSRENFIEENKYIDKNLEGDLRNYAKARLVNDYYKKGFGSSKENVELLKKTIETSENSRYSEILDEVKTDLENFEAKFSIEALNTELVDLNGQIVLLKDVLNSNPDKIKILNFWASWCSPCIKEIKKSEFRNKLIKENNLIYVFISTFDEKDKWSIKSKELQGYLNSKHQYFLANENNSTLVKTLKIKTIPNYVILDKENRIILNNAPKPSDSLSFNKLIDRIDNQK